MKYYADLLILAGIALLTWGSVRVNTTFGIIVAGALLTASGIALAKANAPKGPNS